MKNILPLALLFFALIHHSCTQKNGNAASVELPQTINELKIALPEWEKKMEDGLAEVGVFQNNYINMREKMKSNNLVFHEGLRSIILTYKDRGLSWVKAANTLKEEQQVAIAAANSRNEVEVYQRTIQLYDEQLNKIDALKSEMAKIEKSFLELYPKVLAEKGIDASAN